MAPQEKKRNKKSSSPNKEKSSGTKFSGPPPDFPKQLQDWKIRDIIWGSHGVCKSWKLPSKRCKAAAVAGTNNIILIPPPGAVLVPSLQLSSDHIHEKICHFLNIPSLPPGFYTPSNYKLSAWTRFGPCLECWFDTRHLSTVSSSNLILNSNNVDVPPGGIMLLTGISRPSLLFIRSQNQPDSQFPIETLNTNLNDPYDPLQRNLKFTNGIGFRGKFYALSLHGFLAVVEEIGSKFAITGRVKNRGVPSVLEKSRGSLNIWWNRTGKSCWFF